MTSRGVIFRPGCPLMPLRSPASRCWNFFNICSMWSPSAPARSSVTGLRLSGLFRRLFRSILGTMILVARPRASFTSAIYTSSSVGPQWGLTFLRRGRCGDLPSPPCVLQDVVSDGSGCRQPFRGAGALFSSCLSRPRVVHHSRGHASVFVQEPNCRPVSPSCHYPAFPQQPSSLPRCHPPHIPHPHCQPSPPRLRLHTPLLFCLPSCRSPELLGSAGRFRSKHSGLGHPRT